MLATDYTRNNIYLVCIIQFYLQMLNEFSKMVLLLFSQQFLAFRIKFLNV